MVLLQNSPMRVEVLVAMPGTEASLKQEVVALKAALAEIEKSQA